MICGATKETDYHVASERRGRVDRCRQRCMVEGHRGSGGWGESRKLSKASCDLAEWRALTFSSSSLNLFFPFHLSVLLYPVSLSYFLCCFLFISFSFPLPSFGFLSDPHVPPNIFSRQSSSVHPLILTIFFVPTPRLFSIPFSSPHICN